MSAEEPAATIEANWRQFLDGVFPDVTHTNAVGVLRKCFLAGVATGHALMMRAGMAEDGHAALAAFRDELTRLVEAES